MILAMGPLSPLCPHSRATHLLSAATGRSMARLALAATLLTTSIAQAVDYYVSPQGDDAQAGTQAQPWKNIQNAANHLQPGDTAHVLPGTYVEKVSIQSSGSADKGWVRPGLSELGEGCRFANRCGRLHLPEQLACRPPLVERFPQHWVEACPCVTTPPSEDPTPLSYPVPV